MLVIPSFRKLKLGNYSEYKVRISYDSECQDNLINSSKTDRHTHTAVIRKWLFDLSFKIQVPLIFNNNFLILLIIQSYKKFYSKKKVPR